MPSCFVASNDLPLPQMFRQQGPKGAGGDPSELQLAETETHEAAMLVANIHETVLDEDTLGEVIDIVVDIRQRVRIGVVTESAPVVEIPVVLFQHPFGTNEV